MIKIIENIPLARNKIRIKDLQFGEVAKTRDGKVIMRVKSSNPGQQYQCESNFTVINLQTGTVWHPNQELLFQIITLVDATMHIAEYV